MLKHTAQCMNHLTSLPTMLLSKKVDLLAQQTRNTFILKRKYPVGLYKKNQRPPPLKSRHYVYEMVENTNVRKRPNIDVILLQHVKNIGVAGDRITMSSERAYNQLLLPQLAVYATPENVEKYKNMLVDETNEIKWSSLYAERTLSFLSTFELNIVMSKTIPWTLETWHVRTSFRKAGIFVPDDAITIPEKQISGPDLSIEQKVFCITVTINKCEQTKVKCRIYHWAPEPSNRNQYEERPYNLPCEALFPEEQTMIDSLPKHRLAAKQEE